MATSDQSQYVLRYNQISNVIEYGASGVWTQVALSAGEVPLTSAHILVGNGSGVATDVALTGAVAITNAGLTSLVASSVTGALLTGYVSGAGTVASSDTILQGIDKLNGNAVLINTHQVANIPGVTTPAGTGTVTPDASASSLFDITVSGALTLNGPSSPTNGQKVMIRILNDASHSVTLATGSGNFRFGTDITSYTNSVSKTDYIGAVYNSTATRWDIVSIIQGF